jgi:hypothetical protein
VAAATEFDDQPGAVRDRLVRDQRDMLDMIATVFRTGIAEDSSARTPIRTSSPRTSTA